MIKKILLSVKAMLLLISILVISIITATLLERAYGNHTAQTLIYNTIWFELLWIWVVVILFFNLIYFKLWRRKKWAMTLFPFALFLIVIGFIITRHFAIKGYISLREGDSTNKFISPNSYLKIKANKGDISLEKEYSLKMYPSNRSLIENHNLNDTPLSISVQSYFANANKGLVEDPDGKPVLELGVMTFNHSNSCFLEKGEIDSLFDIHIGFREKLQNDNKFIKIEEKKGELWITSNCPITRKTIETGNKIGYKHGDSIKLDKSSIYIIADSVFFSLIRYISKGRIRAIPVETSNSPEQILKQSEALDLKIETKNCTKNISLFSGKGIENNPKIILCDGITIELFFGAKTLILPFSLHLLDFKIKRYKGSKTPSQFQSNVVIEDFEYNIKKTYSIYMNHILKYRGYRIYQYSFHKDEKGTIFFVSRDPGTPVTYTGFILLLVVIILSLFHTKSRIWQLEIDIRKLV